VGAVRASSVILDATRQAQVYSPQLAPVEARESAPFEGAAAAAVAAEAASSEPVAESLPGSPAEVEPIPADAPDVEARRAVAMAAPPLARQGSGTSGHDAPSEFWVDNPDIEADNPEPMPAPMATASPPVAVSPGERDVVEQPTAGTGMVEQPTAEMDMAEHLAAESDDERPTAEMPATDAESASSPSAVDQPAQVEPAASAAPFEDELEYADTQLMPAPFDAFDPQPFDDAPPPFAQPAVPEPVVPPPPPIPPPPPAPAPTPSMPVFAPSPAFAPVPSDPMIMAVECPYGHSNPPEAGSCRVCGTPIQPQAPRLVGRPVLAVLFASDGNAAELDRAVLIGRAPDPGRSSFKDPRLLTVESPGHDISRTHVQVAADGWQIVVTDLQSTNGTTLIRPGGYDQQRLTPGEPVPVQLGSVLELGDGVSVTIGVPQ
jgi:hypothetical protein